MDRIAAIRAMFDTSGRGLEIGPSYNPIMPKAAGFDVEVLDHASTEEIRAKYRDEPNVDANRIEPIDHVWDGRPLPEVVGGAGVYDYVVASHVIEHTPDMLGFLEQCGTLLKDTGRLVLAVPDKRRCFDLFRPLTSTGMVLQAHLDRRRVHSPATAFDHVANMAALDGTGGWAEGAQGEVTLNHPLHFAKAVFDRSAGSTDYHDFHGWVFCPSSFRLIVSDLNEIGALDLREVQFQTTPFFEFFVTLSRSGTGPGLSRIELLRRVRAELAEFPES